jgi:hypothetical protein
VNAPAAHTDIDQSFVPRVAEGVAATLVDDEVLVLNESTGSSILLNGTGSIVWQCLDGESSVAEICTDLTDLFRVPLEQVAADVIRMVLQLGYLGLIKDISPPLPPPPPASAPPGTALATDPRPGLDGADHSVQDLAGSKALVINWNASCGWCQRLTPDLVEVLPRLREAGVALALVINGDLELNRTFLAENALDTDITLISAGSPDPIFGSHGTPVAYAIDETGVTTAPLARGANEVPALIATLTDD